MMITRRTILIAAMLASCCRSTAADHCTRLIQAVENAKVEIPEVKIDTEFISPNAATVQVQNQLKTALPLSLHIDGRIHSVRLPPLESRTFCVTQRNEESSTISVTAVTPGNRYDYSFRKPKISVIHRLRQKVTVDGNLDEYAGHPAVPMMTITPPDAKAWGAWLNDSDLSAEIRMAYDSNFLYLAVEVRDDIHIQELDSRQMWKQDNLEFTFIPRRGDRTSFRFGLRDGKAQGYCWNSPVYPIGPNLDRVRYQIRRNESDKTTFYEAAIPFQDLMFSPNRGELVEIRLAVCDCDDPGGMAIYQCCLESGNAQFVFGK